MKGNRRYPKRIICSVSEEVHKALKELAELREVSVSAVIRSGIRRELMVETKFRRAAGMTGEQLKYDTGGE